jgi:hypothetical protein
MVALCPRRWYLRWARGLVAKERPEYLMEGTLVHLALAYFRAEQMAVKPAWYLSTPLDVALERVGQGHAKSLELARNILAAYRARAAQLDGWEPVAIEYEYTVTLGELRRAVNPGAALLPDDGEVVSARIDLMLRANGQVWACDYKTTRGVKGNLPPFRMDGEYALNWQFLLQTAILKVRLGKEFRAVVVERILKSPPYYSSRDVAPCAVSALRGVPDTVASLCRQERAVLQQATEAQARGEDMETWMPPGNFWACHEYNRPCEYAPLCRAESVDAFRQNMVGLYNIES